MAVSARTRSQHRGQRLISARVFALEFSSEPNIHFEALHQAGLLTTPALVRRQFVLQLYGKRRKAAMFSSPTLPTGAVEMNADPILKYLRAHGQQLDREIAVATGIPLPKVRSSLTDLSMRGEISHCSVTRYNDGKAIEGMLCRIAGTIPPKAPGRKPAG